MNKLALNIVMSLLYLIGVVSCNIKEDISNCPGSIILDYSAYTNEVLDDIASDEQVDIFIFDPEGICIDVYSFSYGDLRDQGFEFEVPIQYRGYNAVVWHGLNSDNYASTSMKIGGNLKDFYMKLIYDKDNLCYSCVPDPLWSSPLEPIDFCAKITRHRIHMTRIHTEVNISVQEKMNDGSLVGLSPENFVASIKATNNVYHTDYSICEQSCTIEYTDEGEDTETINSIDCSCLGTLRITPNMDCKLEVVDNYGKNILINGSEQLDLVEYMLQTKGDNTLSDQQFLDLNKIWNINLIVDHKNTGYIALGLNINGWVVWFTSSDLN